MKSPVTLMKENYWLCVVIFISVGVVIAVSWAEKKPKTFIKYKCSR